MCIDKGLVVCNFDVIISETNGLYFGDNGKYICSITVVVNKHKVIYLTGRIVGDTLLHYVEIFD